MTECIFCKIIKREIPCFKVYEDEHVLSFADINPISDGHILIIPKQHAENIFEISEEALSAIHLASKKIASGMKSALDADGIACLQLNGRGVNQVVMHYHLHLIPHLSGSPKLTMTDWELRPGDMSIIKNNADKIISALK